MEPDLQLALRRPIALETHAILKKFLEEEVAPAEKVYVEKLSKLTGDARWQFASPDGGAGHAILEPLKKRAKQLNLFNLFLPEAANHYASQIQDASRIPPTPALSNLEYAHCAELMGRSLLASEVCNCSAPDTGNMEVLWRYGSEAQKDKWLVPLLSGEIRSSFFMTEPDVASSDARNIRCSIRAEKDASFVLNGRKWWSSGAMDPRCSVGIFMGRLEGHGVEEPAPDNNQSMVLLPLHEGDAGSRIAEFGNWRLRKGLQIVRGLSVFGYDDAPHGHAEVKFTDVRIGAGAGAGAGGDQDPILLGPHRGFEIAQGRLGPGRVHHCMRCVGAAEKALESMLERGTDVSKKAVGFSQSLQRSKAGSGSLTPLAFYNLKPIAESRIEIEQMRLLVLSVAARIDAFYAAKKAGDKAKAEAGENKKTRPGPRFPRKQIAMMKAQIPRVTCGIIDRAIQLHGGEGVSGDQPLAYLYAIVRTLRLADGPDEVHLDTIAKLELVPWMKRRLAGGVSKL